jgi:hypothetical protein
MLQSETIPLSRIWPCNYSENGETIAHKEKHVTLLSGDSVANRGCDLRPEVEFTKEPYGDSD